MTRLPLEVQTLYGELLEQLVALEAHRSIARAPGCFTLKTVRGEAYYYFQYSEPGGVQKQVYVGKKDTYLDKLVDRYRSQSRMLRADARGVQRLCALLRAGGALMTDAPSARVLKALAESGAFHLGAVLVGTHAFVVLGNLLGVRWEHAALRTLDVDIATGPGLGIAFPERRADIPQTLARLEMGFLPVPALNPRRPSTLFKVRGRALRADLLVPALNPRHTAAVFIPGLNAAAQPVRFLDFLIERPERGALIDGGGVLVQVPAPARYALHKLLLVGERPVSAQVKAEKDLNQATQLLSVLAEDRQGDLLLAWEALQRRGERWRKQVRKGVSALARRDRDLSDHLRDLLHVTA
jgi:hypothetical protein